MSLFLGLSGFAIGGFTNDLVSHVAIGPGDETAPLDESHIVSPLPQADVDRIKQNHFFASMSDAEVQQYVAGLRRAILYAVGLIKGENFPVGDGLEQLYRSNGICLGLAPLGHVAIVETVSDTEPGLTRADVMNVYPIRDLTGGLTEYQIFKLYDALSRAGYYSTQDQKLGEIPSIEEEKGALDVQVLATEGSLSRHAAMRGVLESLRDSNQVPAAATGAVAVLGRSLKSEGNPVRVQSWLLGLRQDTEVQQNRFSCYTTLQRTAELAVGDHPDLVTVVDALHQGAGSICYSPDSDSTNTAYLTPAPVILGDFGSSLSVFREAVFQVLSPEFNVTLEIAVEGMDAVSDLLRTSNHLWVAASNYDAGFGIVNVHQVDPLTGALNNSVASSIQSPLFKHGVDLCYNTSGNVIALSRGTGELSQLIAFPPQITSVGFTVPNPTFLGFGSECEFASVNTVVVSGFAFDEWETLETTPSICSTEPGPFHFGPVVGSGTSVRPCVFFAPDLGTDCLEVWGTPGRTFSITSQSGGGPATVIGGGQFGWGSGRCTTDISAGATNNTLVRTHIVDSAGSLSAGVAPITPTVIPRISFVRGSHGDLNCKSVWAPGTQVSFASSTTLAPGSFTNILASGRADRCGNFYGGVPGANLTLPQSGFYNFQSSGVAVTPVATADSFTCTVGKETICRLSDNDAGCPEGCSYELVSPPTWFGQPFPADAFQFSNDGTVKVTMLNFYGGTTFTYRPIYRKVAGAPVEVVLVEDTDALINPRTYIGEGGVEMVEVPCIIYGVQSFPLYQFYLRPPDNCPFIHWHWRFGIQVYSLEAPSTPVDDPDQHFCGFGIFGLVPILPAYIPKTTWTAFLNDHP